MSDTVIKVENLSKSYTLRHQTGERYTALRDVLANGAKSLGSRLLRPATSQQPPANSEEFWALNDVSFEVKQGERVGIIGRNGAGKSTLLKILSRITEPTKGRVHIKGRVASLLEVGTGFHPELTGRENIYLNGAILGMSRDEIRRKFDEIVAFAEVEKFLDTPVKRYSSGMYVRLAFAVAAHLEPEILVVDEVLAVGDVAFQKKCLGKMESIATSEGRTIFFVSHNMTAVQLLCNKAIHIENGQIIGTGETQKQIQTYLSTLYRYFEQGKVGFSQINANIRINKVKIEPQVIECGSTINISLQLQADHSPGIRELSLILYSVSGIRVAIFDMRNSPMFHSLFDALYSTIKITIENLKLVEGNYSFGLWIADYNFAKEFRDLAQVSITAKPNHEEHIPYAGADRGFLEVDFQAKIVT